jgi:hypothetical protein
MLSYTAIVYSILILIAAFTGNVEAIVVDSSHVQSQIMQFDYDKVSADSNTLTVKAVNITSKS